jgi:small subunit ribosomal protein S2
MSEIPTVGLNEMLEAGVHFGHQTRRWNPKMRPYIFTERNGIHIIDLRKTLDRLLAAQAAVRDVTLKGGRILFVCTKRQLRPIVEEEARRCGGYFVTERWLGGMLTNFQTIRKQIRRLKELERGQEENAFEFYTKKERLMLDRERIKLDKYFSGVKDMSRLPGAVFVIDARRETIAVKEAHRLGLPVIAITDTNADPDPIDFPIPGNDDAIRAVSLISKAMADAVIAAQGEVPADQRRPVEEVAATTYSTETGEKATAPAPQAEPARRRPRRKRVPRPEVIAAHRKGEGEEELGAENDEVVAETEAVEEPTQAPEKVEAVADEASAEVTEVAGEAPEAVEEPATEEAESEGDAEEDSKAKS